MDEIRISLPRDKYDCDIIEYLLESLYRDIQTVVSEPEQVAEIKAIIQNAAHSLESSQWERAMGDDL
jgi:hypothetical protein